MVEVGMQELPCPLGPYLLIHKVAEGGLALVFLALRHNQPHLIKVLKTQKSKDKNAVDHFVREVRIASKLQHPNLVPFVDSGKVGSTYFAVMPMGNALGLDRLLSGLPAGTPAPLPLTLYVARHLMDALSYLHQTTVYEHTSTGLFHGDLSPDNILIFASGEVRLTDFGSAGQQSFSDETLHQFGKLSFLPFEITQKASLSPATDIYALAVTLFVLLFGRKPFLGAGPADLIKAIRDQDVPRLDCGHLVSSKRAESELRIFFNQALNKKPALRFATVDSFRQAFNAISFREAAAATPEDLLGYLPEFFTRQLKEQKTALNEITNRFRESSRSAHLLRQKFAATKVENILAFEDVRRYPRARVESGKVDADVVSTDMRWKSTFSVYELSQGGVLLQWKALPSQKGLTYPIFLRLNDKKGSIRTLGEVCYEIRHQAEICVGIKFKEIAGTDQDRIAKLVERLMRRVQREKKPDPNTVDVFFRTPSEWKQEFEENIQHGGLFVRAAHDYPLDTPVKIRIHLAGVKGHLELTGKVVFCQPMQNQPDPARKHSLGVALSLSEDQAREIQALLNS